jgi:hypothetical protein
MTSIDMTHAIIHKARDYCVSMRSSSKHEFVSMNPTQMSQMHCLKVT